MPRCTKPGPYPTIPGVISLTNTRRAPSSRESVSRTPLGAASSRARRRMPPCIRRMSVTSATPATEHSWAGPVGVLARGASAASGNQQTSARPVGHPSAAHVGQNAMCSPAAARRARHSSLPRLRASIWMRGHSSVPGTAYALSRADVNVRPAAKVFARSASICSASISGMSPVLWRQGRHSARASGSAAASWPHVIQ
jgi:hypothetical protein